MEIKSKKVKSAPKSCASSAIMCIAALGLSEDFSSAYAMHIENAKRLGLVPNDLRAIRISLEADHGFVLQSTRLEGIFADEAALTICSKLSADDLVIMQISDFEFCGGGSMAALKPDGCSYRIVYPCERYDLSNYRVRHLWVKTSGLSPYPQRNTKTTPRQAKSNECEVKAFGTER